MPPMLCQDPNCGHPIEYHDTSRGRGGCRVRTSMVGGGDSCSCRGFTTEKPAEKPQPGDEPLETASASEPLEWS